MSKRAYRFSPFYNRLVSPKKYICAHVLTRPYPSGSYKAIFVFHTITTHACQLPAPTLLAHLLSSSARSPLCQSLSLSLSHPSPFATDADLFIVIYHVSFSIFSNLKGKFNLTQVAKTILNLANFTLFGDVKELHMDFLNRFVAEEMPTMRALLWRLSEPPLCEELVGGVTESSGFVDTAAAHSAKLVDVLTVLKQNPTDNIALGNIATSATGLSINSVPVNSFCNRCISIMLESEFQRPTSHHDFARASGPPVSSNIHATNSHEELLRHQWMTELQDLQADVSVCQQAIFGIPGQLTASGHSMELDQLNLAASLAHCHAQLEAAFTMVPQELTSGTAYFAKIGGGGGGGTVTSSPLWTITCSALKLLLALTQLLQPEIEMDKLGTKFD
ncbi:hypothetical protein ACTXT7_003887 [Hymenolepis weldensis]